MANAKTQDEATDSLLNGDFFTIATSQQIGKYSRLMLGIRRLVPHVLGEDNCRAMQTSSSARPYSTKMLLELAMVPITFVGTFAISSYLELSESFVSWSGRYEETLNLDELPLALLASIIALTWFAWQRWQDTRRELDVRVKAEQELMRSQAQYKTLFTESLTANAVLSPSGHIRMCNPAFATLIGAGSLKSAADESFSAYLSDPPWSQVVEAVTATQKIDQINLVLSTPRIRRVHAIARIVGQFELESLQSLHLFAADITEIKLAESEIRELLNHNHFLLQQSLEQQEEERKRIAQDLHDDMGQYLNAIKADATSIVITEALPSEAYALSRRIISHSDHIYRSVRQMIHRLRPVALDDLGLSAALRHLIETWRTPSPGTQYSLEVTDDIDGLQEHIAINTYRIVQEGLSNAARHAGAAHVSVCISLKFGTISIHIQDDGGGMDMAAPRTGLGLAGMRERIAGVNGQFILVSAPGQGVAITAIIPAPS